MATKTKKVKSVSPLVCSLKAQHFKRDLVVNQEGQCVPTLKQIEIDQEKCRAENPTKKMQLTDDEPPKCVETQEQKDLDKAEQLKKKETETEARNKKKEEAEAAKLQKAEAKAEAKLKKEQTALEKEEAKLERLAKLAEDKKLAAEARVGKQKMALTKNDKNIITVNPRFKHIDDVIESKVNQGKYELSALLAELMPPDYVEKQMPNTSKIDAPACDKSKNKMPQLNPNQEVAYIIANAVSKGLVDTAGCLFKHGTGAGKTLIAVLIMQSFWNKTHGVNDEVKVSDDKFEIQAAPEPIGEDSEYASDGANEGANEGGGDTGVVEDAVVEDPGVEDPGVEDVTDAVGADVVDAVKKDAGLKASKKKAPDQEEISTRKAWAIMIVSTRKNNRDDNNLMKLADLCIKYLPHFLTNIWGSPTHIVKNRETVAIFSKAFFESNGGEFKSHQEFVAKQILDRMLLGYNQSFLDTANENKEVKESIAKFKTRREKNTGSSPNDILQLYGNLGFDILPNMLEHDFYNYKNQSMAAISRALEAEMDARYTIYIKDQIKPKIKTILKNFTSDKINELFVSINNADTFNITNKDKLSVSILSKNFNDYLLTKYNIISSLAKRVPPPKYKHEYVQGDQLWEKMNENDEDDEVAKTDDVEPVAETDETTLSTGKYLQMNENGQLQHIVFIFDESQLLFDPPSDEISNKPKYNALLCAMKYYRDPKKTWLACLSATPGFNTKDIAETMSMLTTVPYQIWDKKWLEHVSSKKEPAKASDKDKKDYFLNGSFKYGGLKMEFNKYDDQHVVVYTNSIPTANPQPDLSKIDKKNKGDVEKQWIAANPTFDKYDVAKLATQIETHGKDLISYADLSTVLSMYPKSCIKYVDVKLQNSYVGKMDELHDIFLTKVASFEKNPQINNKVGQNAFKEHYGDQKIIKINENDSTVLTVQNDGPDEDQVVIGNHLVKRTLKRLNLFLDVINEDAEPEEASPEEKVPKLNAENKKDKGFYKEASTSVEYDDEKDTSFEDKGASEDTAVKAHEERAQRIQTAFEKYVPEGFEEDKYETKELEDLFQPVKGDKKTYKISDKLQKCILMILNKAGYTKSVRDKIKELANKPKVEPTLDVVEDAAVKNDAEDPDVVGDVENLDEEPDVKVDQTLALVASRGTSARDAIVVDEEEDDDVILVDKGGAKKKPEDPNVAQLSRSMGKCYVYCSNVFTLFLISHYLNKLTHGKLQPYKGQPLGDMLHENKTNQTQYYFFPDRKNTAVAPFNELNPCETVRLTKKGFDIASGKFTFKDFLNKYPLAEDEKPYPASSERVNITGNLMPIVLATGESYKGVDMLAITNVILLDPIDIPNAIQLFGRGPRLCSHHALSLPNRKVEFNIFRAVNTEKPELNVDLDLAATYVEKYNKVWVPINSAIANAAVDKNIFGPTHKTLSLLLDRLINPEVLKPFNEAYSKCTYVEEEKKTESESPLDLLAALNEKYEVSLNGTVKVGNVEMITVKLVNRETDAVLYFPTTLSYLKSPLKNRKFVADFFNAAEVGDISTLIKDNKSIESIRAAKKQIWKTDTFACDDESGLHNGKCELCGAETTAEDGVCKCKDPEKSQYKPPTLNKKTGEMEPEKCSKPRAKPNTAKKNKKTSTKNDAMSLGSSSFGGVRSRKAKNGRHTNKNKK